MVISMAPSRPKHNTKVQPILFTTVEQCQANSEAYTLYLYVQKVRMLLQNSVKLFWNTVQYLSCSSLTCRWGILHSLVKVQKLQK